MRREDSETAATPQRNRTEQHPPLQRRRGPEALSATTWESHMAIADIVSATDKPPHKVCAVCFELGRIAPSEAAALRALLSNPSLKYSDISKWIAEDPDTPINIDGPTLSRHARAGCSARERLR